MRSGFLKVVLALTSVLPASAQSAGIINTIAGNGYQGKFGMGGPANAAELSSPNSVAVDKNGNLFIADLASEHIYRVDASTGNISVFAGTGAGGYSGDGGPAKSATFNHPYGLAFGPNGDLYISDSRNNVIRKIDMSAGTIDTVVGSGFGAGPGDGDSCGTLVPGKKAKNTVLCNPFGIAVDANNNIFFTNANSQVLEVVASTHIVSVVAGTGSYGYAGDGGPAQNANLSWLPGLALDSQGNIYIADSGNCAIREVNAATGIITSLVGSPSTPLSGNCGLAGDRGPASAALIKSPFGISIDPSGNIFFCDTGNNLVRMISAASGNIYTVAGSYTNGNGVFGYSGDGGPAVSSTLADPYGVTASASGNLYISDNENFAVREVTQPAAGLN
jgi:trimeric autotransporter adhesin